MASKKTYTAQEKTEILAFADANSVLAAHEKFGVSVNSINKWKKGDSEPKNPSKSDQLDKLLKFRDKMLDRELQNPETRNIVWDLLITDPAIRAKIGDLLLDAA